MQDGERELDLLVVIPIALDIFATSVVNHLDSRRGMPITVSSLDYQTILDWHAAQIPLQIITEAIDSCFDYLQRTSRDQRRVTLAYVKPAVRDLWEERRDLYVG